MNDCLNTEKDTCHEDVYIICMSEQLCLVFLLRYFLKIYRVLKDSVKEKHFNASPHEIYISS